MHKKSSKSFSINNKLIFTDSFQFLSSSLDSLVENLVKDDFNYLSPEFNGKILHIVKQRGFSPYEYISGFEKIMSIFLRFEVKVEMI